MDRYDLESLPFDPAIEAGNEAMAEMKKSSQSELNEGSRRIGALRPSVPGFGGPDPRVARVGEKYVPENGIKLMQRP